MIVFTGLHVSFKLQTFCGRRVEIESTPLEITRAFIDPTAGGEDKKALVVTVGAWFDS